MTNKSQYRQKLDELLNATQDNPANAQPSAEGLPDELVDLVWQFAETELSPTEEQRFWQLLAQYPQAAHYLKEITFTVDSPDQSLDTLPTAVLGRLRAAQGVVPESPASLIAAVQTGVGKLWEQTASLQKFMADISLEVAHDFLRALPGTPVRLELSSARSEAEPRTSVVHQLLKRIGIIEVTIDHVGDGRCDLTIRITESSDNHPIEALSARLVGGPSGGDTARYFHSNALRFADLAVGDYGIVFQQDHKEVDRLNVSLQTLQDS